MCCPNSFRRARITPLAVSVPLDGFSTVQGVELDQTCYEQPVPEYYYGDTWTTDNSGVVTVSGSGSDADLTAVSSGDASIFGHWEVFTYTMGHNDDGHYCEELSRETNPSAQIAVCPKPTSETTAFSGWDDAHSEAAYGLWTQTLLPASPSLAGRTVFETDPGGGTDTCWTNTSIFDPHTHVTGGQWTVGSGNTWGPDQVGFQEAAVPYYRQHGRAPCAASFPQLMVIGCLTGPPIVYQTNTLGAGITSTTVTSIRAGSQQSRTWP
jgi:hypothetical protein